MSAPTGKLALLVGRSVRMPLGREAPTARAFSFEQGTAMAEDEAGGFLRLQYRDGHIKESPQIP